MDVLAIDINAWMYDCCSMAAAAMNAWMRELWMHGCCCYERVDAWMHECVDA